MLGLSVSRATDVLTVGAGVVGTAFVQNSNPGGLDPNVRDVAIALLAIVVMAKTDGYARLAALGAGAAAASSLLRRNIITV